MPKTPWAESRLTATLDAMTTPANLIPNLRKLAAIQERDKIRVRNGLADINRFGFSFARQDEDSILATGGRGGVWALFFDRACRASLRAGSAVTLESLRLAAAGLRRLRRAYSGDAAERAQVEALIGSADEVLREVAVSGGRDRLYGRWGAAVRRFNQERYLAGDSEGACYGFCYDWARRVVFRHKASYFQSKKGSPPPDDERFRRKVEKRVRSVQRAYELTRFSRHIQDPRNAAWRFDIGPVDAVDVAIAGRVPTAAERQEGWRKLIRACRASRVEARPRARHTGCFIVGLVGQEYGHAVALRLSSVPDLERYTLFDPNVGEADFGQPQADQLAALWDDLILLHEVNGNPITGYRLNPLYIEAA